MSLRGLQLISYYYDVMYSESYDLWQLVIAFPLYSQQQEELMQYAFDGVEDMGVDVSIYGERAVVTINCRLQHFGPYYNEPWESFDDEDDQDDSEAELDFETDDSLLLMLAKIREQLMKGDYRALYEVWLKYAYPEDEDEWPKLPKPKEQNEGNQCF